MLLAGLLLASVHYQSHLHADSIQRCKQQLPNSNLLTNLSVYMLRKQIAAADLTLLAGH